MLGEVADLSRSLTVVLVGNVDTRFDVKAPLANCFDGRNQIAVATNEDHAVETASVSTVYEQHTDLHVGIFLFPFGELADSSVLACPDPAIEHSFLELALVDRDLWKGPQCPQVAFLLPYVIA